MMRKTEKKTEKSIKIYAAIAAVILLSVVMLVGMNTCAKEKAPDTLKVDVVCQKDYWNVLDLSNMSFSNEEEAEALAQQYLAEIEELLELDGWWKEINPDADTLLLNWQMANTPESYAMGNVVKSGANTVEGSVLISIKGGGDGALAHELAHVIGFGGKFSYALADGICEYVQAEVGENLYRFNQEWDWQEMWAVMFRYEYGYNEEVQKQIEEICSYVGAVHVGYPYGQTREQVMWYQLNHSFVRYLIEQYGLTPVKQIALQGEDENSYEVYLGKTLEELRQDWIDYLLNLEPDITIEDIIQYYMEIQGN
jgi:hypothetical protein